MPMTLKDVAKEAGCSVSTASFAVRGCQPGNVKIPAKTVKRIRGIAKQLGYRTNRIAASLKNQKTNLIGISVPALRGDFYERIFHGINEQIFMDYTPVMAVHDYVGKRERKQIESFIDNRVDGIIATFSGDPESEDLYRQVVEYYKIPLVLIDRGIPNMQTHLVSYDNYALGYDCAKSLYKLGHKRIMYVEVAAKIAENLESIKNCREGYLAAMSELNLDRQTKVIVKSSQSHWANGDLRVFADEVLDFWEQKSPKPDVFMVNKDWLGYEIIAACSARKINVPNDLCILGMSNNSMSHVGRIGFAPVNIDIQPEILGQKAGELITKLIESPESDSLTKIRLPIDVTIGNGHKNSRCSSQKSLLKAK